MTKLFNTSVFYCGACMEGHGLDHHFVYFPSPWQQRDWAKEAQLPLRDVFFQADDGTRLHGWYVEVRDAEASLLWCHGNAGNIINRLDQLVAFHRRGLSVFVFDYRGYGQSEGHPTERGLYADAQAAYTTLTETLGCAADRLVIFSQSLGCAVAGHLAGRKLAAALILEAPFPSIAAVASAHYGLPLHFLLKARYPLASHLKKVSMPVLVMHGDQDSVIPAFLGKKVFQAARPPKAFYAIAGADHNNTHLIGGEAYFQTVLNFVRQAVR